MNVQTNSILNLSSEVQGLIDELHKRAPDDRTFDQVGIINSHTIIRDYVDNNEIGVAVEHLLYVITESNIEFPEKKKAAVVAAAKDLGIKVKSL